MPKNLLFSGPLPDFLNDQPISWIQVDPAQLHNAAAEVSRILLNHNKIQSLHLKIMDSFLHSRGFSTVLDEISQSLNTAIVVMDMSGKIISYSKPFSVADPLWRESVAKGYCPPIFHGTSAGCASIRRVSQHRKRADLPPMHQYPAVLSGQANVHRRQLIRLCFHASVHFQF